MSDALAASEELLAPTREPIRAATLARLPKLPGVDQSAVAGFPDKLAASVPAPLSAKASLIFAVIYGKLTVDGLPDPYAKWHFNADIWGIGATGGTAIGIMYTAYDSWAAFFASVTAYHVQGIASGGGILQVNWFNKSGVPVGQFNGAMAGAGGLEAGGPGTWKS